MPDFWTHIVHSSRVAKELEISFESEQDQKMFNLGSQGPDPYSYVEDNRYYLIAGKRLHSQKCGKYLKFMIRELFKTNPFYVYGLVCHHTLDRICHPYIISQVGNGSKHDHLEEALDEKMIVRYMKQSPEELNPDDFLPNEIPDILEVKYLEIIYNLYRIEGVTYSYAVQRMKQVLNGAYSRSGIDKIFSRIEKLFGGRKILRSDDLSEEDVLNLSRSPWYHPTTGWESHSTFLDLFDDAVEKSKEIVGTAVRFSMPPDAPELSFMTGLPCVDY
ncbi:MAG: zinc dependent phospholipase C family protein [Petrotogales bacterium]